MRRDLDLIRKIILAVEALPGGSLNQELKLDGYTREEVGYHSYLVVDSGLALGEDVGFMEDTSPIWQISQLTAAGHDFADSARNDTTWNKAKGLLMDKGGSFTIEIVKELLTRVVKGSLGLE